MGLSRYKVVNPEKRARCLTWPGFWTRTCSVSLPVRGCVDSDAGLLSTSVAVRLAVSQPLRPS